MAWVTATDTAEIHAKSLHGTLEGRRVNVCRTFASFGLVNFAGARGFLDHKGTRQDHPGILDMEAIHGRGDGRDPQSGSWRY